MMEEDSLETFLRDPLPYVSYYSLLWGNNYDKSNL
jgi:hypothetical protein